MKGKQLLILLVVVAVLGGIWFVASSRNGGAKSQAGATGKLIEFPPNEVEHVQIKSVSGELNLLRKDEGWIVRERGDYPANVDQISGLVRKLWDLKAVQDVKAGPSQMPRLELADPGKGDKTNGAGVLVQLMGRDNKPVAGIVLGKKYSRNSEDEMMGMVGGFPAGRYVKPASGKNAEKAALVSEVFQEVEPNAERWLSKEFFRVDAPKSIAVKGAPDAMKWSIFRETPTGEWKLADTKPDESMDTGKVLAAAGALASPQFKDVLASDSKLEEPVTTVVLETFDGLRYEVQVGKASAEDYPVRVKVSANLPAERTPGKDEKPEDKTRLDSEFEERQKQLKERVAKEQRFESRIYLVAKYVVDPLIKERSALLQEKPKGEAAAEPGKTKGAGAAGKKSR